MELAPGETRQSLNNTENNSNRLRSSNQDHYLSNDYSCFQRSHDCFKGIGIISALISFLIKVLFISGYIDFFFFKFLFFEYLYLYFDKTDFMDVIIVYVAYASNVVGIAYFIFENCYSFYVRIKMFNNDKENNKKKSFYSKYGLLSFMIGHGLISETILGLNSIDLAKASDSFVAVYRLKVFIMKIIIVIIIIAVGLLFLSCVCGKGEHIGTTVTTWRNGLGQTYACGIGGWLLLVIVAIIIFPIFTSVFGYLYGIGYSDITILKYLYLAEISAAFIHSSSYSSYYYSEDNFDIRDFDK